MDPRTELVDVIRRVRNRWRGQRFRIRTFLPELTL